MYAFGLLCFIASAVAHPAAAPAQPPVIEYALPMGYYAPPGPLLRTIVEDPKAEKGIVAALPDIPALAPMGTPVVQEVLIENEPKKEPAAEKPVSGKPEEGKLTTVKIEMARPPIVRRLPFPSWLSQIPIVANVITYLNPQSQASSARSIFTYPILLRK